MRLRLPRHTRELPPAVSFAVLLLFVGIAAPSFFSGGNVRDLALDNAPKLLVAVGSTLVILTGEIDISVGSQFAVCSVAAGWFAKAGLPMALVPLAVLTVGATTGAINGFLVARLGLPSIIVTLATLVAWRDGLRWATQGAWVQDLPIGFQWFGLPPYAAQSLIVAVSLGLTAGFAWLLRNVTLGRALYAVGSDREAARLAGIEPPRIVLIAFSLTGALTALAAALNAVRFAAVPSNAGMGLELETIAAVVVGGVSITGGRGSLAGTVIGVSLLGTISTALAFVGISPQWTQAIQGAIILAALATDVALGRLEHYVRGISRAAVR